MAGEEAPTGFTGNRGQTGRKPFQVEMVDGVFRVVQNGQPVPEIDNGGFDDEQEALDAASRANVEVNRGNVPPFFEPAADTGSTIQNRPNEVDRILNKAGVGR